MTALAALDGLRIAVWGAGIEGTAAVEALAGQNEVTVVADDPQAPDVVALAERFGLPVSNARTLADTVADLVVRSPAVSIHRPDVQSLRAAGVTVTTLLSLWLQHARPPLVIGVTGTKGKSSTSLMIHALLDPALGRAEVVGNIGRPITEAAGADVAVVEISSYQAADLTSSPDIGVLTNLGVDHLPWHGSPAQYHADKLHMFAQADLRCAALGEPIEQLLGSLAARHVDVAVVGAATYAASGGVLRRHGEALASLAGSPFAIEHFGHNLALACVVAEVANQRPVSSAEIEHLARTFELPPGRMELVAEVGGVRWINDCLASNPMAAAAGVDSHRGTPLVLILGGGSRGVDVEPLVAAIRRHGDVRRAVVIGEVARQWAGLLDAVTPIEVIEEDDVTQAVEVARRAARTGDTVLFSPAAPTSATVGTWVQRRAAFIDAVRAEPPTTQK